MNAIDELRGIFDNFACNVAAAYKERDWVTAARPEVAPYHCVSIDFVLDVRC